MGDKGFAGGPFQLLISIIVFGMALFIGAYLFDMIQCWSCNEGLHTQAVNLRTTIETIGRGNPGSRDHVTIKMEDLGSCAEGIYLKHIEDPSAEGRCRSFCPSHPNSCWVILTNSRCGGAGVTMEDCINIAGSTEITNDDGVLLEVTSNEDAWLEGSYGFGRTMIVRIEKTGPEEITIGKP